MLFVVSDEEVTPSEEVTPAEAGAPDTGDAEVARGAEDAEVTRGAGDAEVTRDAPAEVTRGVPLSASLHRFSRARSRTKRS